MPELRPAPGTRPAPDLPSGQEAWVGRWSRIYALVLGFLALLIALFAWLTRIYS
jgi:hypothetical protein